MRNMVARTAVIMTGATWKEDISVQPVIKSLNLIKRK